VSGSFDIESLKRLDRDTLRRLWTEHAPRRPPPTGRGVLVRELAWHIQQREHGGLDAATARLLEAAIREDAPRHDDRTSTRRVRRGGTSPELTPGSKLIRTWRGRTHEVVVRGPRAFEHRGITYRSLTEVARAITGSHWSGPRFFGLVRERREAEGGRREAGKHREGQR